MRFRDRSISPIQTPGFLSSPGLCPTTKQCSFPSTSKRRYHPKSSCSGSSAVWKPRSRSAAASHRSRSSPKHDGFRKYGRGEVVLNSEVLKTTTVRSIQTRPIPSHGRRPTSRISAPAFVVGMIPDLDADWVVALEWTAEAVVAVPGKGRLEVLRRVDVARRGRLAGNADEELDPGQARRRVAARERDDQRSPRPSAWHQMPPRLPTDRSSAPSVRSALHWRNPCPCSSPCCSPSICTP
jgi:hypothetical protein